MTLGPPGETLVPGYEVIEHLHQSNHYDVYEAWSEERACRCIAKVLRQDEVGDRTSRRALIREGRLLESLTHPHIARAYEVIESPRTALILETLTGETLGYLIDESYRRLSIKNIAFLGLHLCSAIHYLHRHDILHLDLKPTNIVSERGLARVLDLSVARAPGKCHAGVGTRNYMSPEQARGGVLGPAADVWGIGAVLFEATTGEVPFDGEDEIRYEQLERPIEPIREYRRTPAAFASLVESCLDPDPTRRPTVDELAENLTALT
ncbi:MAG: serine/threonine-protein kinase [Rubrobacteraceae bacterium]